MSWLRRPFKITVRHCLIIVEIGFTIVRNDSFMANVYSKERTEKIIQRIVSILWISLIPQQTEWGWSWEAILSFHFLAVGVHLQCELHFFPVFSCYFPCLLLGLLDSKDWSIPLTSSLWSCTFASSHFSSLLLRWVFLIHASTRIAFLGWLLQALKSQNSCHLHLLLCSLILFTSFSFLCETIECIRI